MSLSNILIPLRKEIDDLENVLIGLLGSQVPFVQSVAEYVIRNGGKRLRPALTLLCARLSGYHGEAAYKMGSCLEFIHTASLLHDDVIDSAKVRRGKPSANAKWGNHVSVLVGDFFYCRASQLLTEQGDLRILKIVTDAITALTEGEVLEITKSSDFATTEDDYLAIIRNKTAVLFAAACQVGGVLGKVSPDIEKALHDYGLNLGMAFQLADDVLDYVANDETLGKTSGTDLQEGKLTLPVLIALNRASESDRQIIKKALMSDRVEPAVLKQVNEIIRQAEGFEQTHQRAVDYANAAKASLSALRPSMEKDMLLAVADYVFARES